MPWIVTVIHIVAGCIVGRRAAAACRGSGSCFARRCDASPFRDVGLLQALRFVSVVRGVGISIAASAILLQFPGAQADTVATLRRADRKVSAAVAMGTGLRMLGHPFVIVPVAMA